MLLVADIRSWLRSPNRFLADLVALAVVTGLATFLVGLLAREACHIATQEQESTTPFGRTWDSIDTARRTLIFSQSRHDLNNTDNAVFVVANFLAAIYLAFSARSRFIEAGIHPLLFISTGAFNPPGALAADSTSMGELTAGNSLPPAFQKTLLIICLIFILITAGVACYAPIRRRSTTIVNTTSDANPGVTHVRSFGPAHALDIFMLVSCSQRFVVSVGFDRQIRLWDLTTAEPTNRLVVPTAAHKISWPISIVALDDHGEWLAVCSQDGSVALWNCRHGRFGRHIPSQTDSKVSACFFVTTNWRSRLRYGHGSGMTTRLLIVLETGNLVDIDVKGTEIGTARICAGTVQQAYLSWTSQLTAPKLLTVTTDESVFISANREGSWTTQQLQITAIDRMMTTLSQVPRCVVVPSLRGVAFMHDEDNSELHLVDLFSDALIYTFRPRPFRRGSLRAFHPQPQQCVYCGSTAVSSFSIAYTEKAEGGGFNMTTVAAPRRNASQQYPAPPICLRSERDARERRCAGFTFGVESSHSLANPGVWEATGANGVAGVRQKETPLPTGHTISKPGALTYRGRNRGQTQRQGTLARGLWEAWSMTALGVTTFHELTTTGLPAKEPGPACRLARNAVALGLANSLVVVQFGGLLRDDDDAGGLPSEFLRGRLSRRNSKIAKASTIKGAPG